jgi:CRISPR-associated endoribonuclease Cas6
MRIRLTLEKPAGGGAVLPINYQYELSAWIYRTIHRSDADFATWLHEQGYSYEGRRFKHFTFSNIKVPQRRIEGDRLHVLSDQVEMQLGFGLPDSMQHFIQGLFQEQRMAIGDRISRADFVVQGVEVLPEPPLSGNTRFRTLSPVCITEGIDGDVGRSGTYLGPDHPHYGDLLGENLKRRFASLFPDRPLPEKPVRFTLASEPRSRLVHIKAHTAQETRVRGFAFQGVLTGPEELLRIAYDSGLGEKGSLGFGCVEVL